MPSCSADHMQKRNPDSPWNPARAAELSPEEYEKQVVEWLGEAGGGLEGFDVKHRAHLAGSSGDYEFDAVAEFTALQGARMTVLVECKRHSRPIERGEIMALHAKLREVGAHKAMIFATCGFQRGALDYAQKHGIATVTFVEGRFLYETKALGPSGKLPSWADVPHFAGIWVTSECETIHCSTVDRDRLMLLREWLAMG